MTGLLEQVMELPTRPEYVAEPDMRLGAERERRRAFHEQIPDGADWEFINGEISLHSPDQVRHMAGRGRLVTLLLTHVQLHTRGTVLAGKGLCVFPRNDFMPDVILLGPETTATLQPNPPRLPVPDFACEILSDSTAGGGQIGPWGIGDGATFPRWPRVGQWDWTGSFAPTRPRAGCFWVGTNPWERTTG